MFSPYAHGFVYLGCVFRRTLTAEVKQCTFDRIILVATAEPERLQRTHERLLSLSSAGSEDSYFWRAYSSDLKRAKDTAEIALKSQLLHESERLRLDERLREYALGVRWV